MTTITELPERKQKYVRARVKGKSKRQAAKLAGYSPLVAKAAGTRVETADVREVFQGIVQRAVNMDTLAKVLVAGLHATQTKLAQVDGHFSDERELPDYGERRAYAELCAEYAGYVTKDVDQSGKQTSVNIGTQYVLNGSATAPATPTQVIDVQSSATSADNIEPSK